MITPLKVIFAGVPDVGKSTLIGSLLQHTGSVFDDQRQSDLAHYTDGLQSEQAEGRTIDVSYRTVILPNGYRTILIDTPGHTELLTNFVSGVSGADLVLALCSTETMYGSSIHVRIARDFNVPVIRVLTKADSIRREAATYLQSRFAVDSVSGTGVPRLISFLEHAALLQGQQRRAYLEEFTDG